MKLGFTNVYCVDTGQGLVVVDAGPDYEGAWEDLTAGLAEHGYRVEDVRAVLVTHFHLDHAGLARRWQDSGVEIVASQGEERFLSEGAGIWLRIAPYARSLMLENGVPEEAMLNLSQRWAPRPQQESERSVVSLGHRTRWRGELHMTPVTPNRLAGDGEILSYDGIGFKTIICPGHSPFHAVFFYEKAGILFSGDHVLPRITPNPGIYFLDKGERMKSLVEYLRALEKVRDLPAQRVLPAHEYEMENLKKSVDRIARHHRRRSGKVLKLLAEQPRTAYDLAPHLFPRVSARQLWLMMAEVLGHLDVLEAEGRAVSQMVNNRIIYRAA